MAEALTRVLGEFSFASCLVLAEVRQRLRRLVDDHEDEEESGVVRMSRTREEPPSPRTEAEALDSSHHRIIYYRLVQDSLEQAMSSPRSVICDDSCDESSCVTIHH